MKFGRSGTAPLVGLVGAVWFACLTKGGSDLWAVTVLCGWFSLISLYVLTHSVGHRLLVPVIPGFVLVGLAFLTSASFSYDRNTTHMELWIWFFSAVAFYLFIHAFRNSEQRLLFLRYSGLVMVPLMGVAVNAYIQHPPPYLYSHWAAQSLFTNSAVLAGFATSWAIPFWHFRHRDRLFYGLFAACVITLLLARSWWSFLSVLVGFGYYYRKEMRRALIFRRKTALGAGAVLAGFLLLTIYLKVGPTRESLSSLTDRWIWWMAGLRMLRDHPFVGVGLGSYATAFPLYKPLPVLNTLYAHSFPIELLCETGALGTGALVYAALSFSRLLRKHISRTAESNAYRAALLSLLCFSVMTIYLDYFIGKLMLAMITALTLSEIDLKSVLLSKKTVGLLELGLLLLIPGWYFPFRASQYHVEGLRYEEHGNAELAKSSFQKALNLNPYQDETYAQLAQLYRDAYERRRRLGDLVEWRFYMDQAIFYKKAIHYLGDLSHPPNQDPPPL